MLLNVINPWDVRASLLKETGRATGEVALSTHTYVHKCKDQSAYFTGVNNPMTYPADVVLASGVYMVRHRSRRRLARPP